MKIYTCKTNEFAEDVLQYYRTIVSEHCNYKTQHKFEYFSFWGTVSVKHNESAVHAEKLAGT